jgi:hypothetical protein
MYNQTILQSEAEIKIKVVLTSAGYQVQSTISTAHQEHTAFGRIYKSEKRANNEAAKWVKYQMTMETK